MRSPSSPPPLPGTVILFSVITLIVVFAARRAGTLSEDTLIYFVMLVPSIILHEISHGYLANMFGDDTAKRAGRLTLNPLRHVDVLGTFIIPGVLLLSGSGTAFGYAKPVPVNSAGMSKNQSMFVGLVGPATNIALAVVAAAIMHVTFSESMNEEVFLAILYFGMVNVVLAVFNLIPIPPLDGAAVIERFLPQQYQYAYYQFRKYAIFVLLFLVLMAGSVLNNLFEPALRLWANLLPFDLR